MPVQVQMPSVSASVGPAAEDIGGEEVDQNPGAPPQQRQEQARRQARVSVTAITNSMLASTGEALYRCRQEIRPCSFS